MYLIAVNAAYFPSPPQPPLPGPRMVPVAETPPEPRSFGWLWRVMAAWEPVPPMPQQHPTTVVTENIIIPDDPPFHRRDPLWPILRTWEPRVPDPQQSGWLSVTNVVPLGRVFAFRPRTRTLALLSRARSFAYRTRTRVFSTSTRS